MNVFALKCAEVPLLLCSVLLTCHLPYMVIQFANMNFNSLTNPFLCFRLVRPSWLRRRYPVVDFYPRRNRHRALRSFRRYEYGRRIRTKYSTHRRRCTRVRVHKFEIRFDGHWRDWTAEDQAKTYFPVVFARGTILTNYEYYKVKGLNVNFIPGHSAEQSDNTRTSDIAAQVCIRRLNNGIVPNDYTATDVRAEEYEDSEMVCMSGDKIFYTSKFGARGFMLTEPVEASASPGVYYFLSC